MAVSQLTPARVGTNLSAAGTPQQVTTVSTIVRSCVFYAPLVNTGNLYLSPNAGGATATLGITLAPGESYSVTGDLIGGEYKPFNLSEWYFDGGTSNDDLVINYWS